MIPTRSLDLPNVNKPTLFNYDLQLCKEIIRVYRKNFIDVVVTMTMNLTFSSIHRCHFFSKKFDRIMRRIGHQKEIIESDVPRGYKRSTAIK